MDRIKTSIAEKPLLLLFLSFNFSCFQMLSETYSNALFLSIYSTQYLTLYFLANPIAGMLLYHFFTPILSKSKPRDSCIFILAIIVIIFISYQLMLQQLIFLPFIHCLLIALAGQLVPIIAWNTIATTRDVHSFKQHVFHMSAAVTFGQVSISFFTPVIVHHFHNIGVFYTAMLTCLLTSICIYQLKPISIEAKEAEHFSDTPLRQQSYFKSLFILILITMLIDTLIKFSFRSVLIGQYSQDGLATFISLFNGCLYAVTIIGELLLAERVLFWLGMSGTLLLTPLVCLIFGAASAISPTLPIIILLRATKSFCKNNFLSPFTQILVYPYPSSLRKKINFYLAGYANPIGGIIAAGIIFITTNWLTPHFIGVFVMLASIWWIITNRTIRRGYQEVLHASLKENRYDPDLLELPAESVRFIETDLLQALNNPDRNVVKTALDFFSKLPNVPNQYINLQTVIGQKLSDPDIQIRYKAALALKHLNNSDCASALKIQLNQEKTDLVGWTIVQVLIHFKIWPTDTETQEYLQSKIPYKVAYSLISLDHTKESHLKELADKKCLSLLDGHFQDKLLLAMSEKYFSNTQNHQKEMELLLQDPADLVSIEAIKSMPPHANNTLIHLLFTFLGSKTKSWFAEKKLMEYPGEIIDPLLNMSTDAPSRQQFAMIRLLSFNHSLPALNKLITLSKSNHMRLRLAIAQSVLRYAHYDIQESTISEKIIEMLEWSANEIHLLKQLDSENNQALKYEINAQLYINRCVFIAWFSLLTNKYQIASIANYIEKPHLYPQTESANAYELLNNLSTHARIRHSIKQLSTNITPTLAISKQDLRIHPDIILLKYHQFKYQENMPMNIMDKTILLRQIKLFESVPVESIQAIAEITQKIDVAQDQIIFNENDIPDGFYCIISGTVCIKKNNHTLSELHEADYFGELGLLDGMPRSATAIASTNGALLYIEKEDFLNILEDLPEIMRIVVGQIIRYLRQNINEQPFNSP